MQREGKAKLIHRRPAYSEFAADGIFEPVDGESLARQARGFQILQVGVGIDEHQSLDGKALAGVVAVARRKEDGMHLAVGRRWSAGGGGWKHGECEWRGHGLAAIGEAQRHRRNGELSGPLRLDDRVGDEPGLVAAAVAAGSLRLELQAVDGGGRRQGVERVFRGIDFKKGALAFEQHGGAHAHLDAGGGLAAGGGGGEQDEDG